MKAVDYGEKQDQITLRNLMRLPSYFVRGIKFHAAGHFYTPKPLLSTIAVTSRCNSRCIMCQYWKEEGSQKEFTPTEFGEIYRSPVFSSLERIVLTGGEATLREDLVQIAQAILDSCPNIREMVLLTNGLEPNLVVEKVQGLLKLVDLKRLNRFSISVSLDGYGDVHEKIRIVPRAFERTSETIKRLKKLQHETPFYLSSTCVVQPLNIGNLGRLTEFVRELELPITFAPVCVSNIFAQDDVTKSSLTLTDDQLDELRIIFAHYLQPNLTASNLPFWREYFTIVNGGKRRLPCFLLHYLASLESDGRLRLCPADSSLVYGNIRDEPPEKIWYSEKAKELRKRVKKHFCPGCTICCDLAFSFTHEFFYYARFLLKEKTRKLLGK